MEDVVLAQSEQTPEKNQLTLYAGKLPLLVRVTPMIPNLAR